MLELGRLMAMEIELNEQSHHMPAASPLIGKMKEAWRLIRDKSIPLDMKLVEDGLGLLKRFLRLVKTARPT